MVDFISKIKTVLIEKRIAVLYGLVFIVFTSFVIFVYNRLGLPDQSATEAVNIGKKADYSSDMNFLDCLSIQHECIYDNVEVKNYSFIETNCKGRNFCSEGIKVIGKRK